MSGEFVLLSVRFCVAPEVVAGVNSKLDNCRAARLVGCSGGDIRIRRRRPVASKAADERKTEDVSVKKKPGETFRSLLPERKLSVTVLICCLCSSKQNLRRDGAGRGRPG